MIWPDVIATLIVSGMGGALAVPVGRRLMLGDVRHDWLQNELEIDRIEPDGATTRNKDGSLSRIWRLNGLSYDAKVEQEQQTLLMGRHELLHQLGSKGLSLRLLAVKRRRPLRCDGTWPSPTLKEIGDCEAGRYRFSYAVDWYIVASHRIMQPLIEAHQLIHSRLTAYEPQAVTQPEDRTKPCPLTGLLNGLVSGEYRRDLPILSSNLSGSLPAADLQFDNSGLLRTYGDTPSCHRVVGIREWPEQVSGRMIGDLLALDGDLEICQVCEPFDRDKAVMLYKRQQQAQKTALIGNAALASETGVVLDLLAENKTTLFTTQFQIIARAPTEEKLEILVQQVGQRLGNLRVSYSVETTGAPICWFSRLPRHDRAKLAPGGKLLRPLVLRDHNIAALWPLHHSPTGLDASPFGPAPVRYFATPTGQAYGFQFHVKNEKEALGNFLIFAPSGSGKSTLLMYLLGGLAKFDRVPSYIFDSKEGTRYMVEAMGGVYQSYDGLELNPLDVGEDTPANRNRIFHILRAMCGTMELTADDKDALTHAVDLAFHLEPPHRTLNEIFDSSFFRRSELRRHMAQWVVDDKGNKGLHSHVFNAPHDSLGGLLRHFMVAINMNEALDDPELGPPVVAHVAAAIGKSAAAGSRGFAIFIDEAAKLLQNAGFLELAKEMYREYRKLGGCVGMAFQDPAALFNTGMAPAFVENSGMMIFLPNANAKAHTFEPFGLNDEQLDFALGKTATTKQRQALVIKREAASGFEESAILDIDLRYLGDALRFFRSGKDANQRLAELKATWGDEWLAHL